MKKIISYIALLFWMSLIFHLSNLPGSVSGNKSESVIFIILEIIFQLFNINQTSIDILVEIIHVPIRELMHFVEYMILGIFTVNLLKQNHIKDNIKFISISFCFAYSVSDEIHQLFVPGRTFEYLDIILDTLGSIVGCIIAEKLIYNRKVQV